MNMPSSRIPSIARTVLGLAFLVCGLNGFLQFLPQPPMSGPAGDFAGAMAATGYLFPLVKGIEVMTGVLLLVDRYVPLALTILAPVVVNIVAFHAFLAPAGLVLPLVLTALGVYLAYAHRDSFAPVLRARVESNTSSDSILDAHPAAQH